jgi:hypothetical protein
MKGNMDLKTDAINFSLNRLIPGVDNIRYDVHLSPTLKKSCDEIITHLVARHSAIEEISDFNSHAKVWIKVKEEFKQNLIDVLVGAINNAKQTREIQCDFLAQTAVVKMFLEEIRFGFDKLVEHYKNIIHKNEASGSGSFHSVIRLKEELSDILQKKKEIIRKVAFDLFQYLNDIQENDLKKIREANFGIESILPNYFFSNPLIHIENETDDFFMIEEYILLGNRTEDPINYSSFLSILTHYIEEINSKDSHGTEVLLHPENMNFLFNYYDAADQLKNLGKNNLDPPLQKKTIKDRKKQLHHLLYILKQEGLVEGIIASYEMQPLFMEFCPPLYPHEILKFLVSPKKRKDIASKMKRLKNPSGKSLPLKPLKKIISKVKRMKRNEKGRQVLRFLKSFVQYHRDLQNYKMLRDAMEWVNLTNDDKILSLSRVNQTLHEFLLPKEQIFEEKPVVNHVIIKTDVRGSTKITQQIKERGLNPASYFSLNYFNPISAILPDYGASKVFIEGDAIILSISEKEETPSDWYSVARACGLAIRMLMITKRYNVKSKKHRLPILEQGIGICYRNTPPTYLFDGDNRIMISPAINLADRLSSCSKPIRNKMEAKNPPFNLYVFQTSQDNIGSSTADDVFSRYNINGIELSFKGFEKLKDEIDLKTMEFKVPELCKDKVVVHTGIFPTISSKYQRLIIREAAIPLVSPEDFSTIRLTSGKYYEVCTNSILYDHVKKKV